VAARPTWRLTRQR